MLRHGSLFSGIGGFDLAAQWMGWENVFQVEIDPFCQKVLAKNFPNVKRYGDIKQFDGTQYAGAVDIISGGFPCQPFSKAGKRKGREDDRYLWPEMLRVINEAKPSYVVGENVAGILSMEDGKTLERILTDLEGIRYQTETIVLPACSVGALHKRDRLWIVAHTDRQRWENEQKENGKSLRHKKRNGKTEEQSRKVEQCGISEPSTILSNTNGTGCEELNPTSITEGQGQYSRNVIEGRSYWQVEPTVGRVANGIPNRVDRIRGLGNAIVPQVAFEIFRAVRVLNAKTQAEKNL